MSWPSIIALSLSCSARANQQLAVHDISLMSQLPTFTNASCYRSQKLLVCKNCSWSSSPPNHNPHEKKLVALALPCSSGPYAAAGQIAITPRRTPTKLTGDPDLPLLDTPSKAICAICFTFHEMSTLLHRSKCIDVSIVIIASSSIWGWPWNRCRVFRWAGEFELFLCGEKKIKCCSI